MLRVIQAIQVFGSVLILCGFILSQWGIWSPKSLGYLATNIVGSGILAIQAALLAQWGFLLLEGAWTLISMYGLLRQGRKGYRPSHEQRHSEPLGDNSTPRNRFLEINPSPSEQHR